MLNLKPAFQRKRAVLNADGVTASVAVDDKLRLQTVTIDVPNKTVRAHLAYGTVQGGQFVASGDVLTVVLDTYGNHPDPRRDDTWSQLMALAQAAGGHESLTLGMVELVVRRAAMLDEVQRQTGDP
jgi:hypothetical protein